MRHLTRRLYLEWRPRPRPEVREEGLGARGEGLGEERGKGGGSRGKKKGREVGKRENQDFGGTEGQMVGAEGVRPSPS